MFRRKHKKTLFLLIAFFSFIIITKPNFNTSKPYCKVLNDDSENLISAKIASDGQWRFPTIDSVPIKFKQCITTFEDKRFYYHFGVDILSIARAVKQNIQHQKIKSGASTLTMQLVRIRQGKTKRNYFQKIKEILIALRIELTTPKNEILRQYASNAPFGGNVIGLEAASWRYFNRKYTNLSWAENALLAVLPNNPSNLQIAKNRKQLKAKRDFLLDKLYQKKIIDRITWQLSLAEPLPEKPETMPAVASHLLQQINKSNSLIIHSTIRSSIQNQVKNIAQQHITIQNQNGIENIAVIVAEVNSGKILAYCGNVCNTEKSIQETQSYVDIIKSKRSTGSILKPILYANALEQGLLLPTAILPDIPTSINGYNPQNFNREFVGAVHANDALSQSLNIPFVKLLQKYGVANFHNDLQRFGATTFNRSTDTYGLSLILGGGETSLFEITGIYASMARTLNTYYETYGKYVSNDFRPLYFNKEDSSKYANKKPLEQAPIIDAGCLYSTMESLKNLTRPNEEGFWQQFSSSQSIAWKTGTSFGNRDAWAIGVTPKYAVGVWVGNADGEGRADLTGVKCAAPILFEIFNFLPKSKWFHTPYGELEKITVCHASGYRDGQFCDKKDTLFVPKSALKADVCPYHQHIVTNTNETERLSKDCAGNNLIKEINYFVLPPTMEYFYTSKHPEYKYLPPYNSSCNEKNMQANMEIIYPDEPTKIFVPRDFEGKLSNVIFQVAHRNKEAVIFWNLDEKYIGKTSTNHQLPLQPTEGKHVLTLVDNIGEKIVQHFEIVSKQ